MAKYYVQSGSLRTIITADSPKQAAVRTLDRAFQPHTWIYLDLRLNDRDRHDHLMVEALLNYEPTLRVSERGFDRADALIVGTPDTIERWHRLQGCLRRLADPSSQFMDAD